jgi:hypothetical protein
MIQIQNTQIVEVLAFLEKIELTPKASRVRTKLNRRISAKVEELYHDEMALLEKFGAKDDAGKLIENDGTYTLKEETAAAYHLEKAQLFGESTVINVDELRDKLGVLISALEESDIKLAGKQAEVLDILLDCLEAEGEERQSQ